MSDSLLRGAVGDELVEGDLSVFVEVHRLEDPVDVSLRGLASHGRGVAHQLVDGIGHLFYKKSSFYVTQTMVTSTLITY